ncbi:hypothetical protein [Aporhodopirellula aestuarii]|uniref:MoxR-vWA-beta-propeller ternary system domain-containing protein n=1 Tax=Aporhodopirellula aestuarii TaxID=2950107 RepID=A0ABT0U5I2_9BACT|nr:hypothetical protein [Aporhodopirellula aestuarii]MCM2371606.1 hypothetical protein [Aporhodopirellula aestuarii]
MTHYLQSPAPELWQTADDGDAFVWSDDSTTIAMAAEVATILGPVRMAMEGLPSLTVAFFIITALRRHDLPKDVWTRRLSILAGSTRVDAVAEFLQSLGKLPLQLRTQIEGPVVVLGCGLENCRSYLKEANLAESDLVLETLSLSRIDRVVDHPDDHTPGSRKLTRRQRDAARCKRAWETLVLLSRSDLDAHSLQTWKSTGLKFLPAPAKEITPPPPPRDPINRLLNNLSDDELYGDLARMSRSASAIVALPRRPSEPESLPIGGVSDVTNRGNPERLLMTELAADPMLLLARIANGQALYLRRETPPGPAPKQRPIAIENGIRCWGSTRIWMSTFALALGASEERRGDTRAVFWTVAGKRYTPEDLTTRDGMLEQLGRLEPDAHPGEGIAAWDAMLREDTDDWEATFAEPLIIVSESTDHDAAFTDSIRHVARPFLIATISRDGEVQLSRRTLLGDEKLQRLKLELSGPPNVMIRQDKAGQPLFLSHRIPPLAFSADSKVIWGRTVLNRDQRPVVWMVTTDQRLLMCTTSRHGCTEVVNDLPCSTVLAHHWNHNRLSLVLGTPTVPHCLIGVNAESLINERIELHGDFQSSDYGFMDSALLRLGDGEYQIIDPTTGHITGQGTEQGHHLGNGFVLRHHDAIFRNDGTSPEKWHSYGRFQSATSAPVGCVVIGENHEPMAIAQDLSQVQPLDAGSGVRLTGATKRSGVKVQSIHRPRPVVCDPTGRWWVIQYEQIQDVTGLDRNYTRTRNVLRVDTRDGKVTPVQDDDFRSRLWSRNKAHTILITQKSVRNQFRGVALTNEGLVFQLRSNHALILKRQLDRIPHLTLVQQPLASDIEFTPFESPPRDSDDADSGWSMRKAILNGGTAWLDSRGLVHLQRFDDHRELTLVLVDTHCAGWFSDFGFFGPVFFAPPYAGITEDVPVPSVAMDWLSDWTSQWRKLL